jgi:hypothetical protein
MGQLGSYKSGGMKGRTKCGMGSGCISPGCGIFSGLCLLDVRYCAGIVMLRNTAFYFFL